MTLVFIYVHDMFIRGPSTTELKGFIAKISIVFALKDLEILSYFIRIEVLYDADCIYISQKKVL